MSLQGKKVLIGLTGGIACYKTPHLIRSLTESGCEVRVVMTAAATKFITPLTLETVSENPVACEMFPAERFVATRHITLANWPDLVIIAPATANLIGKVASGICDDLLATILCATDRPVLMAPAMNPGMWGNKITQRNASVLTGELGWHMVGPNEGKMAEPGHWGIGRMAEPEEIFSVAKKLLSGRAAGKRKKKALTGKRIIVTAGPSREPIDPVRFISNRSSGKMGYAIAEAACDAGAEVVLISGPCAEQVPERVKLVSIETTAELYRETLRHFRKADCLIMAAAPADFTPVQQAPSKIKRASEHLNLELQSTPDILKAVAEIKQESQIVVGFALETNNGVANARAKLKAKQLDLIVLNNPTEPGAGFDHETNRVTIIRPHCKPDVWPLMSKYEVALKLLEIVGGML